MANATVFYTSGSVGTAKPIDKMGVIWPQFHYLQTWGYGQILMSCNMYWDVGLECYWCRRIQKERAVAEDW